MRSSATISLRCHPPEHYGFSPVAMPVKRADIPTILPFAHDLLDAPESIQQQASSDVSQIQIVLDIGEQGTHGYPLLPGNADGILGAQISTTYCGRTIRTQWRPDVHYGRPCEHAPMYRRMTHCSLTSHEILLQVKPTLTSFLPLLNLNAPLDAHSGDEVHGDIFFEEHKRSTCHLTERGGPLAPSNLCIVRCGEVEGPADPIILLGGSVGKGVYIFHNRECWACAGRACTNRGWGSR